MGFVDGLARFIDGLVRPVVTLGFGGTVIYMALIQGNHDAVTVVTTTAVLCIGFWFKDRNQDKAADTAAVVAKVAAANAMPVLEVKP
jgi:tetrahydromethanopterin S-methyltransferase subunit D